MTYELLIVSSDTVISNLFPIYGLVKLQWDFQAPVHCLTQHSTVQKGKKLFICFVEGISNIMTVSEMVKTYIVYSSDTCLVGVPV